MTRSRRTLPVALARRRGPRRSRLLVVVPVVALVVRAPWSDALDLLGEPANRTALRLSLVVSAVRRWRWRCCVGFPIAWLLARVDVPRARGWCERW